MPYLFGNKKGKSLEIPIPNPIVWNDLSFEETLMFHALCGTLNEFVHQLNLSELENKKIYHLFNFLPYLNQSLSKQIKNIFKDQFLFFTKAIKPHVLNAHELQEILDFKNDTLTVFAILNPDRRIPGTLLVRAQNGSFVQDSDRIWSIPVLGLSGRGLSFHHSNGATPQGVYTIDSVMPEANRTYEFGHFRRLILNFMSDPQILRLLPITHHHKCWWQQSALARELGRNHLRIHGSGRTNFNPLTPFFPMIPTSGCLSTNEGRSFFKKAQDQRHLLDTLMSIQGLAPIYENESKIHGLLYVVEFSDNLTALKIK